MTEKNGSAAPKGEEKGPSFRFKWNRRTYEIDLDDLTFGERAELEDFLGQPWPMVIVTAWGGSYKAQMFLAYLAVRRKDDTVSLSDFEDLKESDVVPVEVEADDEARPTGTRGGSGRPRSESASGSARGKSKS